MSLTLAGAAAVSGGQSILNGIGNAINQSISNEQSMRNWRKQFDMVNEYNLPVNQLSRWAAAGINPAVAMQGGQSLQSSMSHATPNFNAVPAPPINVGSNMLDAVNSALGIAQARNQDIKNEHEDALLSAQERKLLADANAQQVAADLGEIDKLTRDARNNAEVRKLTEEYKKLVIDAATSAAQGRLFDQQALTSAADGLLKYMQAKLTDKEYEALEIKVKSLDEYYRAVIDDTRASAGEHRAGAGLKRQQTETESIETGLKGLEFQNESDFGRIRYEQEIEKIRQEVESIDKENDLIYWRFAQGVLRDLISGAVGAFAAGKVMRVLRMFKGAKNTAHAKAIFREAKANKDPAAISLEQYVRQVKENGGTVNPIFEQLVK